MKRDDDYLRELLFEVESQSSGTLTVVGTMGLSPEKEKLLYHIALLSDAGLMTQISSANYRMTNQGHDYLAAVRSDTVWNKTKVGAAKVGGMTLKMMMDVAIAYGKQEVAEKLGINL